MTSYAPAYSISKATLHATTVMLAAALPFARVNCADPGWVRTDMGGPHATRTRRARGGDDRLARYAAGQPPDRRVPLRPEAASPVETCAPHPPQERVHHGGGRR